MSNKKSTPLGAAPVKTSSNEVLETAEMLRASNALCRTSQGILFLCNGICSAEVFTTDELKDLEKSVSALLGAYGRAYSSLMARYSALLDAEGAETSRKAELKKAGL